MTDFGSSSLTISVIINKKQAATFAKINIDFYLDRDTDLLGLINIV